MAENLWGTIREKLLEQLGASTETTVQRIKFGRGTAGKIAVIAVAAVLSIGALGFKLNGNVAVLAAIGGIFLVVALAIGSVLLIIHKHAEMAVLEGAELVLYQQVTLAAKGMGPISDSLPILNPKTSVSTTGWPDRIFTKSREVDSYSD